MNYEIPVLPLAVDLESKAVLRQLNLANKKLAELKGVAQTIPNEDILINTLTLQEAKDSSAVENIVTTHDEIYKAELDIKQYAISASTKEVINYSHALKRGFELVRNNKLLTNTMIKEIQRSLENNSAGFRTLPGTNLKDQFGAVVYTPPQEKMLIERQMQNLETFINDDSISDLDPLIKMAIVHHQFESIHPFYDGNGRTGRIINILYLVIKGLLDLPILYLSRYIIRNKSQYYHAIQAVRDRGEWETWVLFMLKGVESTADETIGLVKEISRLMIEYKHKMRSLPGRVYRHELLNNLFNHPYTKIEFIRADLDVNRITATKYLNILAEAKLVEKVKHGRTNYYLNMPLIRLLMNVSAGDVVAPDINIESISV
ncbi:MAG: Fic family protein [Alistipes sp.]|jgi:Fic family protein|nr:Fic family protein [Alistipes sp.]